jgi:hypothetical protein
MAGITDGMKGGGLYTCHEQSKREESRQWKWGHGSFVAGGVGAGASVGGVVGGGGDWGDAGGGE